MATKVSKPTKSASDQGGNITVSYIPVAWDTLHSFLINFDSKLPAYKTALSISDADLAQVKDVKTVVGQINETVLALDKQVLSVTAFRKNYWSRLDSKISLPDPVPNPVLPKDLKGGMLRWFGDLCNRIKTNPNYTEEMGKTLGIIVATPAIDPSRWQPVVKWKITGGRVVLSWRKGNSEAGIVEVDKKGDGVWETVATALKNTYSAELVIPADQSSIAWRYRVTYQYKDVKVGVPSETVIVTYAR